jgi:hypothetical protein
MNIYTRTAIVWLLLALLVSACASPSPAKQTEAAVLEKARIVGSEGQLQLENGYTLANIAPEAVALKAYQMGAVGAYALYDTGRNLAIFICQGNGEYYLVSVIDTTHSALLGADRQLAQLGIKPDTIRSAEQLIGALRKVGFEELRPKEFPALMGSIRLAIRWLQTQGSRVVVGAGSMGATLSDVILIPAYILTPEMLYPWPSNFDPEMH